MNGQTEAIIAYVVESDLQDPNAVASALGAVSDDEWTDADRRLRSELIEAACGPLPESRSRAQLAVEEARLVDLCAAKLQLVVAENARRGFW
jgi:hypothetical protein